MAKYRELSIEELESMEKEFIDFLALNGIPGDDWIKLKKDDPQRADSLCTTFSDVVFTKILTKCKYIEQYTERHMVSVFCDKNKMYLLGLEAPESFNIDFTDPAYITKMQTDPPKNLHIIKSEKKYNQEREVELWKMISDGFIISDQKLYMNLFSMNQPNEL